MAILEREDKTGQIRLLASQQVSLVRQAKGIKWLIGAIFSIMCVTAATTWNAARYLASKADRAEVIALRARTDKAESKLEVHDVLFTRFEDDLHYSTSQLYEISRKLLGLKAMPPPHHPTKEATP